MAEGILYCPIEKFAIGEPVKVKHANGLFVGGYTFVRSTEKMHVVAKDGHRVRTRKSNVTKV